MCVEFLDNIKEFKQSPKDIGKSVLINQGVYAISWNGTEPARNIPQDAKTQNDRF